MKIAYFPNQIALNAQPVLDAFLAGCKSLGIQAVANATDADAAVIWSVVWNGRMRSNQSVFSHYRAEKKPVFILEVGSLRRGLTWKLSLNNTNALGIFANHTNLSPDRSKILGIELKPVNLSRKPEILIATQHKLSEQWKGMPEVDQWVADTIAEIRKYTQRPIIVRPHPRSPIRNRSIGNVLVELPRREADSYDNYDLKHDYYAVINWNSGVAIQSAIAGTPVITGPSSLAHEISGKYENIESIILPNRDQWFNKILHTEWLLDELAIGIPQTRLLNEIRLDFTV
jgi:hypothetical protein